MTATAPAVRARAPLAPAAVAGVGTALLALRPAIVARVADPVATLVAIFVLLAVVGWAWPRPAGRERARLTPATVTAVGVAAVVAARLLTSGRAPGRLGVVTVALGVLAAVSEELWFRRFLHGLLAPAGAPVAVAGTALVFALVHVPVYGWGVVPLDLAAGIVLGWQRVASGSWAPGAVTHSLANVVVLL